MGNYLKLFVLMGVRFTLESTVPLFGYVVELSTALALKSSSGVAGFLQPTRLEIERLHQCPFFMVI